MTFSSKAGRIPLGSKPAQVGQVPQFYVRSDVKSDIKYVLHHANHGFVKRPLDIIVDEVCFKSHKSRSLFDKG